MAVCPSCGQDNPEVARFCLACGAALAREPAPVREERKVVTVLFCDLVGSTPRAEGADPEDVRALLVQLQTALAFYHSVGATAYVREGEALLAASA